MQQAERTRSNGSEATRRAMREPVPIIIISSDESGASINESLAAEKKPSIIRYRRLPTCEEEHDDDDEDLFQV